MTDQPSEGAGESSAVRIVDIAETIVSDEHAVGEAIRRRHRSQGTCMVNIMASPGAGKTSLIERIAPLLGSGDLAVIEGDVDSAVDTERLAAEGIRAVQIRTGGFCHLSASMVDAGLEALDEGSPGTPRWILLENIGNLICPADFDTGAALNLVILSVPEGHDKPWKYPRIFQVADLIVLNKIDYLRLTDFDREAFVRQVEFLNPGVPVMPVSCRTGQGVSELVAWLDGARESWLSDKTPGADE